MTQRFAALFVVVWAIWLIGLTGTLSAQAPRARQLHETLLLDIDNAATKKFATVQTNLRVGQLPEAIELLRSIGDAHVGKLVATTPGRYVNVQNYVQMLAAGLPPEGLQIYRQQLDPILKPTFETGRDTADEALLQKVLQQGYCCSFADDALLLLGDLAWDAGEVWRARSFWEQILPPPRPKSLGEPVIWLGYPDTDLDIGSIMARLILCTIQSGDFFEVRRELATFAEKYPEAEGRLAGRQGNLSKILNELAAEAEKSPVPLQTSVVETFAGSPQRYHIDTQRAELGSFRWQANLRTFGEEQRRGFQPGSIGGLCYFPVVYGDVVLVNDDENIHAYNLQTGNSAWSDDANDSVIYPNLAVPQTVINTPRAPGEAPVGNIGLPRFTMTVADGRLYARMGSVRPYSNERSGWLVCLDLAQGEGKLIWETFASKIEPEAGGWNFEGSPLVIGSRLYVGLRRLNPQPQSNVACFDSLTGKLIWNRKLCGGQTNPNFPEFDVNQHLLTWGEGTLYFTTHMGAVAALDPQTGTIKWIVSYPRVEDTKLRHEYAARLQRGPLPAMFADGTLYAAPIDSDELMAFDAETGLLKWKRSFNSRIQSLLGVSKGMVFVSGAELWGIATDSGKILWKIGDPDPESHGFGRGLLVEDTIYWPTHEEIFVVDQTTGAIQQRLPLSAVHGQYGGNLLLTEHHLLIAQPNRLAVFSDFGPVPRRSKPLKPEFSQRQAPAARAWTQARVAVETQDWERAATQYEAAARSARPGDEWMGRPLAAVARDREIDARIRHAWQLTQTDPTAAPNIINAAYDVAAKRGAAALPGHSRPTGRVHSELLFPGSVPVNMLTWVTAQLASKIETSTVNDGGAIPVLERTTEHHNAFRRVVATQPVGALEDSAIEQSPAAVPQDGAQKLLTENESYPWPLRRHWQLAGKTTSSTVYPVGTPPAIAAACVLLNQPPLTCLNLGDGTPRWQLELSHPVRWAGFAEETLILATAVEVRAVSVADGATVWCQRLGKGDDGVDRASYQLASVRFDTDEKSSDRAHSLLAQDGELQDFALIGNTLLARQGTHGAVAWDTARGRLRWHFTATRGLAAGWGLTAQHVVLGQLAPDNLVILERASGSELARFPTDSANWIRPPTMRNDGGLVTVGPLGRIEAWSKPGFAWHSDHGPRSWIWQDAISYSNFYPEVLNYEGLNLVLMDGRMLVAVDSQQGNVRWKAFLGQSHVDDARSAIHCADQRVYVAADGILRAWGLADGGLLWERYLGTPEASWRVHVSGATVLSYPSRTGTDTKMTVCDAATGAYLQRVSLPPGQSDVQVYPTPHTTLVACGGMLTGLGK